MTLREKAACRVMAHDATMHLQRGRRDFALRAKSYGIEASARIADELEKMLLGVSVSAGTIVGYINFRGSK